jgi:hypothetical protein
VLHRLKDRKEFKKLFNEKSRIYNINLMENLFSFNLIFYRGIKTEIESKVDLSVKVRDLECKGLLKSNKFPFLYLTESKNLNKIQKKEDIMHQCQTIIMDGLANFSSAYFSDYLPRITTSYLGTNFFQNLTHNYKENMKNINTFSSITLDPLILTSENNEDWFIYDDESLNFLTKMKTFDYQICDFLIKNKYFQDKLPYISLPNKEYKNILIDIRVNDQMRMKLGCSLTSTLIDVLKKISDKIQKMNPKEGFEPSQYALKVLGLNDYIIDQDQPMGISNYFTECIKNGETPEFSLIKSPLYIESPKPKGKFDRRRSSSVSQFKLFDSQNLINKNGVMGGGVTTHRTGLLISKSPLRLDTKNLPTIISPMKQGGPVKLIQRQESEAPLSLSVIKDIYNIGIHNPEFFHSSMKFNQTKRNEQLKSHNFFGINFDEIFKKSAKEKLQQIGEEIKNENKKEEINIDEVVQNQTQKRSRSKAISNIYNYF